MNSFHIIVPPPFEPVSLPELYRSLRLIPEGSPAMHEDDLLLSGLLTSSRESAEQYLRRKLVRQTVEASYSNLPLSNEVARGLSAQDRVRLTRYLNLPFGPVSSIVSVSYYDSENALQTLDPTTYFLAEGEIPQLRLVSPSSAPSVFDRPDAVRVRYVVGYAPEGSPPTTQAEYSASVPTPIKQAIILGVELEYNDHDGRETEAITKARDALLNPYRVAFCH